MDVDIAEAMSVEHEGAIAKRSCRIDCRLDVAPHFDIIVGVDKAVMLTRADGEHAISQRRSWSAQSGARRHRRLCLIDRREHGLDVAIVIRVEQTIGQDAAQQALIGMIMRVDEAWNDDVIGGLDRDGVSGCDIQPDFPNLAVVELTIAPMCRMRFAILPACEGMGPQ